VLGLRDWRPAAACRAPSGGEGREAARSKKGGKKTARAPPVARRGFPLLPKGERRGKKGSNFLSFLFRGKWGSLSFHSFFLLQPGKGKRERATSSLIVS